MSKEIDEKVVELRFNNSNFEKNARATMSTIDRLEEKLNFKGAAKGLQGVDKAANSIKFTILSDAVDKVSVKFNALQVAAFTCFQNITNKAISTGEQLVKSLTIDQVTAGWSKYDQMTTATQTIMAATGKSIDEVSKNMNKLNWFTDETSYSLTDMADNIGKFTSAGVDLSDSTSAMMGIANAAALAGQNSATATRAMFNFSQALGVGYVGLMDWKSIETANMATQEFKQTIIDTAVKMGTLKKIGDTVTTVDGKMEVSVNNFRDTLKKQWFDSDVLIAVLKEYGGYSEYIYDIVQEKGISCADAMKLVGDNAMELGAKAFSAAQEAKTFTDAIEATKDAVSTGWMVTFQTLFGNYVEAKETWTRLSNQLYDIFAEGGNVRNELLAEAMATPVNKLKNTFDAAGTSIEDFEDKLINAARNAGIGVDDLIEEYGSLEKVLKSTYGESLKKLIPKALQDMADDAEIASVSTQDLNAKLEEYNDLVYRIAVKGEFGNGSTRFAALEQMGYDWQEIQGYVNRFVESGGEAKVTIDDLSDAELKNVGYTDEQIKALRALAAEANETGYDLNEFVNELYKPSGRELFIESLFNILSALQHVIETIKEAWSEIFPAPTAEMIYNLIERFHAFTENLMLNEERTEQLKRTFKGLFAVLDIVRQIVVAIVQNGFNLIGRVLDAAGIDVFEFTATIGDNLVALRNWLNEGDKIGTVFKWVADQIVNLITTLKNWGKQVIDSDNVTNFIAGIYDKFETYFPGIADWLEGLGGSFYDFIERVKSLDGISLDNIVATVKAFSDTVWDYITSITADDIKKIFGDLGRIISTFFTDAGSKVWQFVKNMGSAIKEAVESINPLAILLIITGTTFLLVGNRIKAAIDTLIETLMPVEFFIKKMTNALSGFVKEATKSLSRISKVFAFNLLAAGILELSFAVMIFAASMIALSKADPDGLYRAAVAIILFSGVMGVFAAVVPRFVKHTKQLASISSSIIKFSLAIAILTLTVKQFNKIEWDSIWKMLVTILGSAVILSAAVIAISHFTEKTASFSLSIIAFAVGVSILALSMGLLAKLDLDGVFGKLITIGAIIVAMFKVSSLSGTGNAANAFALIGFVVGINMLIATIASIKQKDMRKVLNYLPSIVTILLLMRFAIKATKDAGQFIAKAGVAMLAMSTSILILMQAVKTIANFDWDTIKKSIVLIGALFGAFALVVALSKLAGEHALKAGGMILMMSFAIDSLAIVLWGLSLLDPVGLAVATGVVDSILVLFAILIYNTKNIGDAYKSITAIGVTLGGLLIGLGVLLAFGDGEEILAATFGLALVIGALSIVFDNIKDIDSKFRDLWGTTANLTILLVAVTGAIGLLDVMAVDSNGLMTKAAAISMIMAVMSLVVKTLASIKKKMAKLGKLTELAAFMFELGLVLEFFTIPIKSLNKIPLTDGPGLLIKTASIALLIFTISKIAQALATMKTNAFDFKIFITQESIIAFIVELGIIASALGWVLTKLAPIPFGEAMTKVLSMSTMLAALAIIGGILSRFAYVEGSFTNMQSTVLFIVELGVIAAALGVLLTQLDPMPLEETISKVVSMVAFISGLMLVGVAAIGLGALIKAVGVEIALLGIAGLIAIFIAIEGLMSIMGQLNVLTNGTMNYFISEGFATIGEQIGSFLGGIAKGFANKTAEAFVDVAEKLKEAIEVFDDIKPESVDIMVRLLESIATVSTSLAVSDIFGSGDWAVISEGLADFGEALGEYAESVSNLDDTKIAAIERSVEPTEALIEVLKQIPATGGLLQKFTGDHSWKTIGEGLSEYGSALCSFAAMVSGKQVYNRSNKLALTDEIASYVNSAIGISADLLEIFNNIPAQGGDLNLAERLYGTISWDTLRTGLVDYGKALCEFSAYVSGAVDGYSAPDTTAIHNAISCSSNLLDVFNAIPMPESTWYQKLFKDDAGTVPLWSTLSTGLDEYGRMLASFADSVKIIGSSEVASGVNTALTTSERLVDMMKALNDLRNDFEIDLSSTQGGIWQKFTNGLVGDGASYGLAYALQEFSVKTKKLDVSKYSDIGDAMLALIKPFTGSSTFKSEIMGSFTTQIVEMGKTLNNLTGNEFRSAGKYVVDGFIFGIEQNEDRALTATEKFGKDIANKLANSLGINSPSKVTTEDGYWFVQGFVEGILNNGHKAAGSVISLASEIIEAFNDRMGIHSNSDEMIESGMWTWKGFIEGIENGWNDIKQTMSSLATMVVDNFDISKITELGGNVTAILSGDFSSLLEGFDKFDYEAQMESFTKQLEDMAAAGLEDTDAFKELQKQMNDFKSANESAYNYVLSEELQEAESLYDRLLDDFKKGKVSAGEFDKQYVELLKRYSDQAGELINYHRDQISNYISGTLDEIQSEFENKMSEINSKMDSLSDNLSKSYDDTLIYTTNKDIYDTKVSEYENQISALNRELTETQKRYGENSIQAKKLQEQLRLVNEEMESYKTFYETQGFDDDEIVDIAWSDELEKEIDALFDYADAIEKMRSKYGKDITDPLIEYLGTLDEKKGKKTVDWLNSLSEEEFARMASGLAANKEAARRVAEVLYTPQMEAAVETFDEAVGNLANSLPDTAKSIGIEIADGLSNGFSEEVENSLERLGTSGDILIDSIKDKFKISGSSSALAKENIGRPIGNGIVSGAIESLTSSSGAIGVAAATIFSNAFALFTKDGKDDNPVAKAFSKTIASINDAMESDIETSPVIKPVVDLSDVYSGANEINSIFSYNDASGISNKMNSALGIQNNTLSAGPKLSNGTTNYFTQNNYSPAALSRQEIARDTTRMFQLATVAKI